MIEESPEKFRARMNRHRKNDRKNGLPNLAVQIANSELISSPADSSANHSATPEKEKAQQMTAISGRKCLESFGRFRRAGSWARTFADLLIGTGEWYSNKCNLTWKLLISKSSRFYFQLSPSTLRTEEIGSGLLATPQAMDVRGDVRRPEERSEKANKGGCVNLREQIALIPTPQARDWKGPQGKSYLGKATDLPALVMLPTPKSQNRNGAGIHGEGGMDLQTNLGIKTGLRLQPGFALWMMGYPTDWLDLEAGEMPPSKARAMQSFRKSQNKSSK